MGWYRSTDRHDLFDTYGGEENMHVMSNGYTVFHDSSEIGFITPRGIKMIIEGCHGGNYKAFYGLIKNMKSAFIDVRRKIKCPTYWGVWRIVKVTDAQREKAFEALIEYVESQEQ